MSLSISNCLIINSINYHSLVSNFILVPTLHNFCSLITIIRVFYFLLHINCLISNINIFLTQVGMYAPKSILQKDVFNHIQQKLIILINVTKLGRKRKMEQVCMSTSNTLPQHIYIHRVVPQSEKDGFKSKRQWPISQLRVVDGKERVNASNTLEFELHFERAYKWSATKTGDKSYFLSVLYSVVCQFSDRNKIDIRNLDVTKLKKELSGTQFMDPSLVVTEDPDMAMLGVLPEDSQEEYQDLSVKEEQDLNRLFSQTAWAISNAEAFTGQLAGELELLDEQNIETIMRSEVQITQLMGVLDHAVQELEHMSDHLADCETLLQAARESIEVVQLRDSNLDVEERNSKLLYKDIQVLINKLDLDGNTQDILLQQPLTGGCLDICIDRAVLLLTALNQEFDSGTAMMRSVIDQKQYINTIKESFVARLHRHLITEFKDTMPRENVEMGIFTDFPTLPSHDRIHKKLTLYARLTFWLKMAEPDRLQESVKDYINSAAPLYNDEFRNFFHEIKKSAFKVTDRSKLPLKRTGSKMAMSGSTLEIPDLPALKTAYSGGLARSESVSSNISSFSDGSSAEESDRFENIFSIIVNQFQLVCQREQTFLSNFFHYNSEDNCDPAFLQEEALRGAVENTSLEVGRTMNQDLKLCLTKLFDTLKIELEGFIHRVNDVGTPFQILYILQYIYAKVKPKVIDPSSMNYFEICLNLCLPSLQNHFDKYFTSFKRQIEDIKNQKRTKDSTILSCVRKYISFLVSAKAIMSKFDFTNIGHIERYFRTLMESVSKTIEKASFELNKPRSDVCRFENYQFLFLKLSELKIKCLEGCKEEAKKKKTEFVEAYTRSMLGRPLERLSLFFEGVESQLKKGTKPEEIGFISELHKQELRRCVSLYPGKEVRKGLETIFKKVDKHLSSELGMNQVVLYQMQTQMIVQYKNINDLIDRCYPDTSIKLDFTIGDLIQYFSDIKQ